MQALIAEAAGPGFAERSLASLRVKELEEEMHVRQAAMVCAFNQLLDLRDLNTGVHSTRLAEWCLRVARQFGIAESELHQFEVAALLHDVGKIGVPDSILRKPGPLTPEERAAMNKHPEYSWTILRLLHGLETASLFALHHHESFDGAGYPAKLKESEIPIGSRIVSVIDAFDAMVSSRPYRAGLPVDEAIRRLILSSGTQFDPQIVQCFLKIVQPELHDVFAAAGTGIHAAL